MASHVRGSASFSPGQRTKPSRRLNTVSQAMRSGKIPFSDENVRAAGRIAQPSRKKPVLGGVSIKSNMKDPIYKGSGGNPPASFETRKQLRAAGLTKSKKKTRKTR